MRIVAGTAKGRRLKTPHTQAIRPTADRAREALFSILGLRVAGARVADLFAGTGALGLEALSRGAAAAIFVDYQPAALDLIRENIILCGFSDRSRVLKRDLRKGLFCLRDIAGPAGFDLVFLDPPYGRGLAEQTVIELGQGGIVAQGGLVIVEEQSRASLPAPCGRLRLADVRRYGDTGFWLYEQGDADDQKERSL